MRRVKLEKVQQEMKTPAKRFQSHSVGLATCAPHFGYGSSLVIAPLLAVHVVLGVLLGSSQAAEPTSVDSAVLDAQSLRIQVMQRAAAATISVFGTDGGGGGSGVIISPDGFALTNYHVSSACGDHMRCGLADGSMVDAVIVGVDAVGDVALIKLLGREDFPTAPMGDSSQVRVGQWCFSAGNPFGLATNRQPSISMGVISGTNRYQYPAGTILEYADCIQTDAAVNPGNSGGPLFDMEGRIIGINGRCSFEKRGRVNVGVGYAISINQIRMFLGMLHSGRLLDHASLGATAATDDTGRVVISNILSTSEAYRRGLRYGDEVVSFADRPVTTTNTFKNILGTLPKDIRVPIEVRRSGQIEKMLVRLSGVHRMEQLIEIVRMGLDGEPSKPPKDRLPREIPEGQPGQADPEQSPLDEGAEEKNKSETQKQSELLVQSMIELRPGFANYYFNRLKRLQIHEEMQSLGDFKDRGPWQFAGNLAGESTRVELIVSSQLTEIALGARRTKYEGDVSDAIGERRQGGLAVAMTALRELLIQGPEKLGDSVYLGTLPVYQGLSRVLAEQPWHEVIETLWYDAKLRCYWDRETRTISLLEVFGDEGVDPAEIYLDNYQALVAEGAEYRFPHRWRLQYGTEILLVVELDQVKLGNTGTDEAEQDVKATETPAGGAQGGNSP